ncbi:hypothetical protein [Bacillus phage BC-T25]|nr:hypothetical protein [Bacillus phage BC-T25]
MKEPLKVVCLKSVPIKGEEGYFNIKGKTYDVISYTPCGGLIEVEVEPGTDVDGIYFNADDSRFLVYYREDE